ncbi:MAG: arylsulfatase, partial [Verrucomicrobiae bacterium]|nr:arylsulfatase [Verrucomicrobiae bacterium]
TDAHAGGSTCVPSRYGLLTGRFAVRANLEVRERPTTEEGQWTIASLLQANGYETAMVGKWHQGFDLLPPENGLTNFDFSKPITGGPMDRGFDSFFGMHASLDIPPYFFISNREATAEPTMTVEASTSEGSPDGWNRIQGAFWRAGPIAPDFHHEEVTPRFLQEAKQVLKHYASRESKKPLFFYLALPSPHTPWLPTKAFRGKSQVGMYGDFVMQVDAVVGDLLKTLDETGLAKDTLVVFTSDNGPVWYDENIEHFGHSAAGPLKGKKATLWEGGHREPFIIRWPGKIRPGSSSDHTISFVDVFATFSELVGAEIPTGAAQDSVSFFPILHGKAISPRPPIIHSENSIRSGDWKLILPRKGRKAAEGELYNLRTDLGENNNLFQKRPNEVERLSKELAVIIQRDVRR